MKVTLIDHTGFGHDKWYAAELMIFTKNTRLKISPDLLEEIRDEWSEEKKLEELAYMANTIRSSWEFCDYTFVLEGVTRALTHQLVRHRTGSYAQQTQQVLEVDGTSVEPPRGLPANAARGWDNTVENIGRAYKDLIHKGGLTVEQARGILPTNIRTNIVCKFNLRTLVDIFHQRISPRNLGEFREVAVSMRDEVLNVHPWAEVFIDSTRDKAMAELDRAIQTVGLSPETKNRMLKLVDQLRRSPENSGE